MATPRRVQIKTTGEGEFYYFGLKEKINSFIISCENHKAIEKVQNLVILLDFNIDGLPLYKSKNRSFWPILCRCSIQHLIKGSPFPVAIYYGSKKPPLEEYLQKFVNEMLEIQSHDFILNENTVPVKINSFCCD